MESTARNPIDFQKLELQLEAAMLADQKYERENAAKFRAINQKVGSYEEFRDIVLASHLRPLDKKDRFDGKWKQPWNVLSEKSTDGQEKTKQPPKQWPTSKPSSGPAFAKDWRSLGKSAADQYCYLLWINASHFRQIFRTEISYGLLGEIIYVLSTGFQNEHVQEVVSILEALSLTNRFALSVDFMTTNEKQACQELFHKIGSSLKYTSPSGSTDSNDKQLEEDICKTNVDRSSNKCGTKDNLTTEGIKVLKAKYNVTDKC